VRIDQLKKEEGVECSQDDVVVADAVELSLSYQCSYSERLR
jgi:hypothetical protein